MKRRTPRKVQAELELGDDSFRLLGEVLTVEVPKPSVVIDGAVNLPDSTPEML